MKKHFILVLSILLVSTAAFAQKKKSSDDGKKSKKDSQNQTKFLQPDMEAKEFNYSDRKAISQPLQVTYDLDSAVYQKGTKKKEAQQKAYKENKYYYPARPKDQWELGINLGMAMISGDVKPYWQRPDQNFGVGFTVRKALGYIFSLRGGYNYMFMTGKNWEPNSNVAYDITMNGGLNPGIDYYGYNNSIRNAQLRSVQLFDESGNPVLGSGGTPIKYDMRNVIFHNYRTQVHEVHLEAIANLGNLKFHRERNIVNLYLLGGVSGFLANTMVDQLDANGNQYNYVQAWDIWNRQKGSNYYVNNDKTVKKAIQRNLSSMWDGKYETQAEQETNIAGIKNWSFIPAFTVGAGIQFHATKFMTIGIEQRMVMTLSADLLDGYRWQEQESQSGVTRAMTRDYDNISYTNVQLLFHLGKNRVEPLYWLNPMQHTYKKLSDVNPDKIADDILKDDDEDGVPNKLDKQLDTKKGAPVDVKGIALDSDKDGIIDLDDKEPYSPFGCPIDKFGVAQCPPPACCTEAANANKNAAGSYDCSKMDLPGMSFDDDKYYVSPEYYGNLHQVAQKMQMCPDVKLVVTGYDESKSDRKYNEQLAYNRANAAVDYLATKYGISRDRFVVKYEGGKKSSTPLSPLEAKKSRKVEFGYATDSETGTSNPPAPHPGMKAGSDK